MNGAAFHVPNLLPLADRALLDPHVGNDAAVVVVLRIEDQRLQGVVRFAGRWRNLLNNRFQNVVDMQAGFCTDRNGAQAVESQDRFNFLHNFFDANHRQVDLVDDRDNFEVGFDGGVRVRDGLRLHALKRVDQQQRTFAGRQAPRDLVVEVDVSRRVDQIQFVRLAFVLEVNRDRAGLHRDAAFAFDIQIVEDLRLEFSLSNGSGLQQKLVRERTLAVVNVRNDRKVANELCIHERICSKSAGLSGRVDRIR